MKKSATLFLPVLLGAGGLLLRLLQLQTVFDGGDGLPRSHPLSVVLPLYLLAAALLFLALAWRSQGKKLCFMESFALPNGQPPFEFVCAAMLYLASGALLVVQSVGGGDVAPLVFGALSAVTGLTLLLSLKVWRQGEEPGKLLLPPVLFALIWLLSTYRVYASYPVTTAFYVPVLAQAAIVCGFYQVSAHGFDAGRRRAAGFVLPAAILLALTAAADGPGLPDRGMYLASALALFTYWRCLGVYPRPERPAEESEETEEASEETPEEAERGEA